MKIEKIRIPNDPEVWEQIEIEAPNGYWDTMTLRELIDDYKKCKYIKGSVNMLSDMIENVLKNLTEIKKNEQETKIQHR